MSIVERLRFPKLPASRIVKVSGRQPVGHSPIPLTLQVVVRYNYNTSAKVMVLAISNSGLPNRSDSCGNIEECHARSLHLTALALYGKSRFKSHEAEPRTGGCHTALRLEKLRFRLPFLIVRHIRRVQSRAVNRPPALTCAFWRHIYEADQHVSGFVVLRSGVPCVAFLDGPLLRRAVSR